jgi:hypothetical protein
MAGESTIAAIARERGLIAEILTMSLAIETMAAGPSKPGDADASAEDSGIDAITGGFGNSDNLMSGNDRQLGIGQFAIDQVEIRAANGASLDADADFTRTRCRQRPFFGHQRLPDRMQDHGFHDRFCFQHAADVPLFTNILWGP